MIKVCIFNKSNNVSRFDIFKKFFECVNSKISLTCCTKADAVYQNVLDSERSSDGQKLTKKLLTNSLTPFFTLDH